MNEWTATARSLVEEHLNRHRTRFAAAGAEADEVVADLRRHIESEAAAAGLSVVTESDVRRILAKVDPELLTEPPAPDPAGPAKPDPAPASPPPTRRRLTTRGSRFLLWLFGVALPAFTLGFELWTQACAGEMFDPTPTWWHALLVALVPATHVAALLLVNRKDRTPPAWLWWVHSFVTGVAGGYALVFLPLTPFALIATVFLIGFLPLSPLLAWICALVVGSALKQQAAQTSTVPPAHRWLGWAAALLCLAAPSAPGLLTHRWLETAVHGSPEESTRAVQWLRRFGSEDSLLRACYGQTRDVWSGLGLLERQWMSTEQIQTVFFRVTGQPYNARKPPLSSLRGPGARTLRDFEWDNAVGGTAVAGHVSGLSLHSSRLDAMGNADDGWSYTEWTLEFRNDHDFQPREARAELQLPPGGVVSRVTLWVNGEEREAAFAGTGEVRAAYQQVAVVKRRDPILVTHSGPDRVLMQCFPVPARGGLMKVRLGITAPLAPLQPGEVAFVWPRIAERNFAIRDDLRHHAWLEARQPAVEPPAGWTLDAGRSNALHGAISERAGEAGWPTLRLRRQEAATSAWARDERADPPAWVRQHWVNEPVAAPGRLALVLDGGRGGQAWAEAVRAALEQAGGRSELGVWIAHDGVIEVLRGQSPAPLAEAARSLAGKRPPFVGGHDPVPALEAAWNWAGEKAGSTVLWIHGPQPILAGDFSAIRQRLERSLAGGTRLLSLQAGLGPNRPAKEVAGVAAFGVVPRLGSLADDLARTLRELTGDAPRTRWQRERITADPGTGVTGSRHLVRLWANDEIGRLSSSRQTDEAVKLAGRWQLVTPVSGAVVLETKQQFTEAGLNPVDPLTTPSVVPEPATWALFGVGVLVVWWATRRKRAAA